jgi:CheY-like chemotaxis protein
MSTEKKVLIVDDNMDAADLTAEYLRVFGADVSVAYGGAEALAAARASVPHVIFLDIGMPGMDGYQVAQALRADGQFHDVKIVALTAWGDPESRAKSRESGFDMHLTKPANLSTLLELAS